MQYRGQAIEPFDIVRINRPGYWFKDRTGTVRHRYGDGSFDVAIKHSDSDVERVFHLKASEIERVAVFRVGTHRGTMAEAVKVFRKGNAAAHRLSSYEPTT